MWRGWNARGGLVWFGGCGWYAREHGTATRCSRARLRVSLCAYDVRDERTGMSFRGATGLDTFKAPAVATGFERILDAAFMVG